MFERRPVPTPFEAGPVNAYLGDRTVIDPSPETDDAWAALREALAARGLEPGDVERVLVTHPHPDHFGLARRLREHGASVAASTAAADVVENFEARLEYETEYFGELLATHGMPDEAAETLAELGLALAPYGPECSVDRRLEDGDAIAVGDSPLTAERVRGHAIGELIYSLGRESAEKAVVGDHVLPDITPNPLLQAPSTADADRPRALPAFNDSLERLRSRGFDELLPGHGEPIDRPTARIDEILAAHESRTERVRSALETPATAYEVMHELFEDLPITRQFGGMSEAIGHLDLLEARGEATRRRTDDAFVYERTG